MSASGHNNVDFDALLDLTEYDGQFQSPTLSSSAAANKPSFTSPVASDLSVAGFASSSQSLSGPSHNYDMYRQQTGFVPGAIANTMAVNETNNTGYQDFGNLDYISNFNPDQTLFDFNTSPSQHTMNASDLDMSDFASPADSHQYFSTINPSNIEQASQQAPPSMMAPQLGAAGRLWPGAHSQAAMAKAQAQRQQPIVHQQVRSQPQPHPKPRNKSAQPSDPIVEQKITQLLNSMRAQPGNGDSDSASSFANAPRSRKEEEDMDEDERLLASEEGKKLSSKERRQLRNKVSARAFRSRRKEYISQLEAEIATKVNENSDLRAENRALLDENKRLADLTRMLLASPSFSNFLDQLSANPSSLGAPSQVKMETQQQQPQSEQQQQQQQQQGQLPKGTNPYGPQTQQQIGMAMIPEQVMDFSLFNSMDNNTFNFQPQVFVVDTPEMPAPIETDTLSGKSSSFVGCESKVDVPVIERPVFPTTRDTAPATQPYDAEFESNPSYALFHSEEDIIEQVLSQAAPQLDLFGGLESEKAFARISLVDTTTEEVCSAMAMNHVLSLFASMEPVVSRLEALTSDM